MNTSIGPGKDAPKEINVWIEIPAQADPIKYELDKDTGLLWVDRFIATAMHYPCNYGFIPQTLGLDGDPLDVLVLTPFPLLPGVVIPSRPIGLLKMKDESGIDHKILALPISKLSTLYSRVQAPEDLPEELLKSIQHFFTHYKDLEPGKWVQVEGWEGWEAAEAAIEEGIRRYQDLPLGE